jgi:hypothetical protein
MNLDQSVPYRIRAQRNSFRQIIWNLLQAQVENTVNANLELSARLSRPTEMVIEVKADK